MDEDEVGADEEDTINRQKRNERLGILRFEEIEILDGIAEISA